MEGAHGRMLLARDTPHWHWPWEKAKSTQQSSLMHSRHTIMANKFALFIYTRNYRNTLPHHDTVRLPFGFETSSHSPYSYPRALHCTARHYNSITICRSVGRTATGSSLLLRTVCVYYTYQINITVLLLLSISTHPPMSSHSSFRGRSFAFVGGVTIDSIRSEIPPRLTPHQAANEDPRRISLVFFSTPPALSLSSPPAAAAFVVLLFIVVVAAAAAVAVLLYSRNHFPPIPFTTNRVVATYTVNLMPREYYMGSRAEWQ